jgi:hypothetical protein
MFAFDDFAPISPGSVFATFAIPDTLVVSPGRRAGRFGEEVPQCA